MCGHFRGSNITRVVSTVSEEHLESVWRLASLAPEIRFPVRGQCRDQRLGSYPTETGSHAGDWRLRIGKANDNMIYRLPIVSSVISSEGTTSIALEEPALGPG